MKHKQKTDVFEKLFLIVMESCCQHTSVEILFFFIFYRFCFMVIVMKQNILSSVSNCRCPERIFLYTIFKLEIVGIIFNIGTM